jgi:hypothetical protein
MKYLALPARFKPFRTLLVSAATAALCLQAAILLDWIFIPGWFYLLMFSTTFLIYSLHDGYSTRRTKIAGSKSSLSFRQRGYLIYFIVACLFISGYLFLKLNWIQLAWVLFTGLLITVWYLPVLPFKSAGRLKASRYLQLLVPVLIWTISTTVIPTTFIPYGFDSKFWWLMVSRFLYLLAIYWPCSMMAASENNPSQEKTKPGFFGNKKDFVIIYPALVLATLSLLPAVAAGISIRHAIALVTSYTITAMLVKYSINHPLSTNGCLIREGGILLQTLLICIAVLIP